MKQNINRVLKLPEVKIITTLSTPTIYSYIKRGLFPAPIKLGIRSVGWIEADIQNWLLSKKEENNKDN